MEEAKIKKSNIASSDQIGKNNIIIKVLSHRILFFLHLFIYISVSGLNILIWALTGAGYFWPYFQMFGWGFMIGFHAIIYLMYNDKIKFLSEVSRKSSFGILFVFHAWFYISVNIFLLIIDLTTLGGLFFYWPLSMWGIGFFFHFLGFFTWDSLLNDQVKKIKEKHPDFEDRKAILNARAKISNLWFLLAHISYFIVANIIIYTYTGLYTTRSSTASLLDGTLSWGTIVGVHIFGFYLFFYNETFKAVLKGLILHIIFYGAFNAWMIYIDLKEPTGVMWFYYPLILWGVAIAFHVLLYLKWDIIKTSAVNVIKSHYGDNHDKYKLNSKANTLIFWKWTFLMHLGIWAVGIALIGIQIAALGQNLVNLVYPALGWLIGVSFHGGCFIIKQKNITKFLSWTAALHSVVFISTSALLITINALTATFPWSAIAIGGWFIGLGIHLILAYFTKK